MQTSKQEIEEIFDGAFIPQVLVVCTTNAENLCSKFQTKLIDFLIPHSRHNISPQGNTTIKKEQFCLHFLEPVDISSETALIESQAQLIAPCHQNDIFKR